MASAKSWMTCLLACGSLVSVAASTNPSEQDTISSTSYLTEAVRFVRDAPQFQNTTSSSIESDSSAPSSTSILDTTTLPSSFAATSLPSTSPATSPTTLVDSVTPTSAPQCIDTTATYTNQAPSTVYVTVDSSYEVTVTASSVSITAQPIYETPPSACETTIVTGADSTSTHRGAHPDMSTQNGPESSAPPLTLTNNQFITSTVLVTKKTPVPVVVPMSEQAPVTFNQVSILATAETTPNNSPNAATGGPSDDGSSTSSSSPGVVASIINSVLNSPFAAPASTTPAIVAIPATSTLNGIGVTIESTNVVVGTQTIPLLLSSQTTVVYSGKTFTVQPSEIIAPGTTYQIAIQQPTITQSPSMVTVAGVTVEVDSTQAVISGTTYRIGGGAGSTTIVVNGQTISVGSNGVGFPGAGSTTLTPPMTVAGGFEIVVVSGITMSVDQTEAVISGTHLQIGPGATSTTAVIAGHTVTAGPSGVGVAGSTVAPAKVPTGLVQSTMAPSNSAVQFRSNGHRLMYASEALCLLATLLLPLFLLT